MDNAETKPRDQHSVLCHQSKLLHSTSKQGPSLSHGSYSKRLRQTSTNLTELLTAAPPAINIGGGNISMAFCKISNYAFKGSSTFSLHVTRMVSAIVASPAVKIVRGGILKHLEP